MATSPQTLPRGANDTGNDADGRLIIQRSRSSEIFFAVVGPVGAGASRARESLERACAAAGYTPQCIKVSEIIRHWGAARDRDVKPEMKPLEKVKHLQNLGDEMRKADPTYVARAVLSKIASFRAELNGAKFEQGTAVRPGEKKIAYLIDSVWHPAETFTQRGLSLIQNCLGLLRARSRWCAT
jgi:hypothetical protein